MSYYRAFDALGYPLAFGNRLYPDETGRLDPKLWAAVNRACDEDRALGEYDQVRTERRIEELLAE